MSNKSYPMCTCLTKDEEQPTLVEVTKNGECIHCGYYAFYINEHYVGKVNHKDPVGFNVLQLNKFIPTYKSQRKTEIHVKLKETQELFDVFTTMREMYKELGVSHTTFHEHINKHGHYKGLTIEKVQVCQ